MQTANKIYDVLTGASFLTQLEVLYGYATFINSLVEQDKAVVAYDEKSDTLFGFAKDEKDSNLLWGFRFEGPKHKPCIEMIKNFRRFLSLYSDKKIKMRIFKPFLSKECKKLLKMCYFIYDSENINEYIYVYDKRS